MHERMAELTGSEGLDLVSTKWSTKSSQRFFGIKMTVQLATTKTNKTGADVRSTTVREKEEKAAFLSGNWLPTIVVRVLM